MYYVVLHILYLMQEDGNMARVLSAGEQFLADLAVAFTLKSGKGSKRAKHATDLLHLSSRLHEDGVTPKGALLFHAGELGRCISAA